MEDVVFIEEKIYQQIKRKLNKKNDWFFKEELKKIRRNLGER